MNNAGKSNSMQGNPQTLELILLAMACGKSIAGFLLLKTRSIHDRMEASHRNRSIILMKSNRWVLPGRWMN
jgi:hypothetical protein